MSARLIPLSGVGHKGPACFLLETPAARLVLDLGEGPDVGQRPNLSRVGRVDAILISHAHPDHCGALDLVEQVGNPPIWATADVWWALGRAGPMLPQTGETQIAGLSVQTGRAGHAPGGVWLRVNIGGGLLYMGDHSTESRLYAFDPPPPSRCVVLDASYGLYDQAQAEAQAALLPWAEAGALFPVPAGGRGPEMAVWAAAGGVPFAVDDAVRDMILWLLGRGQESLRPGADVGLRHALAKAEPLGAPVATFAAKPNATGGAAQHLIPAWQAARRPIVFTGYVAAQSPAEALVNAGEAEVIRWNVHPRLSDLTALVRAVGATRVIPAFGVARHLPGWRTAFQPAETVLEEVSL